MYMVMIFHDYECKILNSICFFDTIKDIIIWSKSLLKYNDVDKIERIYKNHKCFFKILTIQNKHEQKYFPKYKKFNRKILV